MGLKTFSLPGSQNNLLKQSCVCKLCDVADEKFPMDSRLSLPYVQFIPFLALLCEIIKISFQKKKNFPLGLTKCK